MRSPHKILRTSQFAATALMLLLTVAPVHAQQSNGGNSAKPNQPRVTPRNDVLKKAMTPIAKKSRVHVGRLECNGQLIGLATVFKSGVVIGSKVSVGTKRGDFELTMSNGSSYKLKLLGIDNRFHVAMFAGGPAASAVKIGPSADLFIGQFVVSVGTSTKPVAAGCVSALNRATEGRGPTASNIFNDLFGGNDNSGPDFSYKRIVQHDSKLEKLDYGSAVFDADGQFVGLNVERAYRGSSYFVGAADLAVILSKAKQEAEDMPGVQNEPSTKRDAESQSEDPKKVKPVAPVAPAKKPGYIGFRASFIELKGQGAELKGTGFLTGMKLTEVAAKSGAAAAGLEVGDVVVEVDGALVTSFDQFVDQLRGRKVGDKVVLTVVRNSLNKRVTVTLGARPKR